VRVGTRIHNPKPVSSATAGRASGKDLRSTLGHGFAALRADAPREVRFRPAAPYGSGPIQTPLFLNLDAPLHAGAHNIPVHCDPSRARLFSARSDAPATRCGGSGQGSPLFGKAHCRPHWRRVSVIGPIEVGGDDPLGRATALLRAGTRASLQARATGISLSGRTYP